MNSPETPASGASRPVDASATRRALGGFVLSGFLAGLLGAILPAWGYHLQLAYATIGHYFLAMSFGVAASIPLARLVLPRGVPAMLSAGCAAACAVLLLLAASSPPAPWWWRMIGLALLGVTFGLINTALFHAISPVYRRDPAATVTLGGAFFVIGCLLVTLLVAGTFYAYSVEVILSLAALLPAVFAWSYRRANFVADPAPPLRLRQMLADFRNPAALLLAMLLFFQFGNEWAVAGWLALFLVARLGISPATSLGMLAFYWLALLVGRLVVAAILPRVPHGRLLFSSAAAAMFGCLILLATDNRFGAYMGLLFTGGGFAAIYPLVAEKIGHRFTYYHPALFNGIFSLSMIGAMFAPATAGYLAQAAGGGLLLVVPLAGTVMVVVLLLLIWLESKIGG